MGKAGWEMTVQERREASNRHEAYADQVMEMWTRGESFRAIERATGVPKSTAEHMTKRLAAAYVADRYGDKTVVLGRELAILDSLTRKNLKRAQDGDKQAADTVLNAHIRRSKLLGLDAGTSVAITVTAQNAEIERLMGLLIGSGGTEGLPSPENAREAAL